MNIVLVSIFTLFLMYVPAKLRYADINRESRENNIYTVNQVKAAPEINAAWDKKFWEKTCVIELRNYMGEKPVHFPRTQVKLRYNKDYIFVIFKVNDRYVKATEKMINGKVWLDSCVEFFFTPGPDTNRGYFNLEANCKGIFLLKYNLKNSENSGFVSLEDCKKVKISHSLNRNVEKEVAGPMEWSIEYSIPISVLRKYMAVDEPQPGAKWRANFYKCADNTSHPHWLTWAPVNYPRPKFHLPEFFGSLEFE